MKVERIFIRKKGYRDKKKQVSKEMEVSIAIKLSTNTFKTSNKKKH